jgi:hypothetical protein
VPMGPRLRSLDWDPEYRDRHRRVRPPLVEPGHGWSRVGSVIVHELITWFTLASTTSLDVKQLWPTVALPAIRSLLKGLGATLADQGSGPSLVPAPPTPAVETA